MPTYEYVCTDCGYEFEEFQSMTAAPLTICPSCGGAVKRKISGGAGLIFKGSGFYETDYKKKPAGNKSTPEKSTSKTSASSKKETSKKSVKKAS